MLRGMNDVDKQIEIARLNKVAQKEQKDVIKHKFLQVNYKEAIADKMRTHQHESRSPLACIYHSAPKLSSAVFSNESQLYISREMG